MHSGYKTLLDNSDMDFIPEAETIAAIRSVDRNIHISPTNPLPKTIPSILAQGTSNPGPVYTAGYGERSYVPGTGLTVPASGTAVPKRAGSIYGPASRGYASLRYYGTGVY